MKSFPCVAQRGSRSVHVSSEQAGEQLAPLLGTTPRAVVEALAKGHTLTYGAVSVVALIRPATSAEIEAARRPVDERAEL